MSGHDRSSGVDISEEVSKVWDEKLSEFQAKFQRLEARIVKLERAGPKASHKKRGKPQDNEGEANFKVGEHVEGRYMNGRWYGATVKEVNTDGSVTLDWHDCDTLERVKTRPDLRKVRYTIGERVEGKHTNGRWTGATVKEVNEEDGSYVLDWHDCDTSERVKKEHDLRRVSTKVTRSRTSYMVWDEDSALPCDNNTPADLMSCAEPSEEDCSSCESGGGDSLMLQNSGGGVKPSSSTDGSPKDLDPDVTTRATKTSRKMTPQATTTESERITTITSRSSGLNAAGQMNSERLIGEHKYVNPEMLDHGDMYSVSMSVWDAAMFINHPSIGSNPSIVIGVVYLLNIVLQVLFICFVCETLLKPAVDAETLNGLLKFRLGVAHRVDYADKVSQRSMVAQVCGGDGKLHMAGGQLELYSSLKDFAENGGTHFTVLIQLLWLVSVLKDINDTWCIYRSITAISSSKTKTRLVLIEQAESVSEGVVTAQHSSRISNNSLSPRQSEQLCNVQHSNSMVSDDTEQPDWLSLMTKARVVTIWRYRVYMTIAGVVIPKLLLAIAVYITGVLWLGNTIDITDLTTNAVALIFILEVDEILFQVFIPRRVKTLMGNLEPFPMPRKSPGSNLVDMNVLSKMVAVVVVMLVVFYTVLDPFFWQLKQAEKIVCSGETNFVYAVNSATGMVHVAKTIDEPTWTDTERVILQVAHPEIELHPGWGDHMDSDLVDVSRSTFTKAIVTPQADSLEEARVDRSSFELMNRMSVWTPDDAAGTLPCEDLASGQSKAAALDSLQLLLGNKNISSCDDVPWELCAGVDMGALRSMCPRHCLCEEPLHNYVGFFGATSFGCPYQCETFKAARNEIEFRYEMRDFGTASTCFELDNHLKRSCNSQGSQSCCDLIRATKPTTFALCEELLENDGSDISDVCVGQSCKDTEQETFGFPGGCADGNLGLVDEFNSGCDYYDRYSAECGIYDDDDFSAKDVCCACGGGHENVPSSAECFRQFTDECWSLPPVARAWLLYVKGFFEYMRHRVGFNDSVATVVKGDTIGMRTKGNIGKGWNPRVHEIELIENVTSSNLGMLLVGANWDMMPGWPHPRNLVGCDYLASFEITALMNLELCNPGDYGSIKFFCPVACGCQASHSMTQCPASCVLKDTCNQENLFCGYLHPWYGDEFADSWSWTLDENSTVPDYKCYNSNHDATSSNGEDCYFSMCQNKSYYDDSDFTENDMCCGCGGGSEEVMVRLLFSVVGVDYNLLVESSIHTHFEQAVLRTTRQDLLQAADTSISVTAADVEVVLAPGSVAVWVLVTLPNQTTVGRVQGYEVTKWVEGAEGSLKEHLAEALQNITSIESVVADGSSVRDVSVALSGWTWGGASKPHNSTWSFPTPNSNDTCISMGLDANFDSYYYDCTNYLGWKETWCGFLDDSDFTSNIMCCECGGGAATLAPTPAPTAPCFDAANGSADSQDEGCESYAARPTETCGDGDDSDFTAAIMCCECGGGAEVCHNTDNGALDWGQYTCDEYTESDWCYYYNDEDFSANDMCCLCGGGVAQLLLTTTVTLSSTTETSA